jgi:hypothetical protein
MDSPTEHHHDAGPVLLYKARLKHSMALIRSQKLTYLSESTAQAICKVGPLVHVSYPLLLAYSAKEAASNLAYLCCRPKKKDRKHLQRVVLKPFYSNKQVQMLNMRL